MVQVDLENADQEVKKAEEIMENASKIVIGQPLRTESTIVKYPDHYIDEKGKATWENVLKIIQGIQVGTITPDYDALGSKWVKHAEKLKRLSHSHQSPWYKDVDEDKIDFEALKDSTLSSTENKKNLKGMWRDCL